MSFNELMDMIREEQDRIELDLNDVNEAIEILDNGTGFRYLWKEGKYDTIYKLAGKFKIFVSQEFLHDVSNNLRMIGSLRAPALTQQEINEWNEMWDIIKDLNIDAIREKWAVRGMRIEGSDFDVFEYSTDQGLDMSGFSRCG